VLCADLLLLNSRAKKMQQRLWSRCRAQTLMVATSDLTTLLIAMEAVVGGGGFGGRGGTRYSLLL
jgi:hypothetical protein